MGINSEKVGSVISNGYKYEEGESRPWEEENGQ
jgi:hypothetical protein